MNIYFNWHWGLCFGISYHKWLGSVIIYTGPLWISLVLKQKSAALTEEALDKWVHAEAEPTAEPKDKA